MSLRTHFVGVGPLGMALQLPDAHGEPCDRIAQVCMRAAHSIARLASIEQENGNPDDLALAGALDELALLTGLACALTDEVVALAAESRTAVSHG